MRTMSVSQTTPSYQKELKPLVDQLGQMLPEEQFAVFNQDAETLAKRFVEPLKLKPGEIAPAFTLSNALGKEVVLANLLQSGPVVLSFYRGTWCPYCNLQLRQYQEMLPQLQELGASFVAISPQTPDASLDMQQKNELQFEVLSDPGNQVARQYTEVFTYGEAPLEAMAALGYNFHSFYSDQSGEIPVPATFVISTEGEIIAAFSEGGDYRKRVEPREILMVLA